MHYNRAIVSPTIGGTMSDKELDTDNGSEEVEQAISERYALISEANTLQSQIISAQQEVQRISTRIIWLNGYISGKGVAVESLGESR